jgi:hypothetical protein
MRAASRLPFGPDAVDEGQAVADLKGCCFKA